MITVALRSLFVALALSLLSLVSWACAYTTATPALLINPPQTGAQGHQVALSQPPSQFAANPTRTDEQGLAGTHCQNCETYASCCQTPALLPEWHLVVAPALPQASYQDKATPFASATDTPSLKPPIS